MHVSKVYRKVSQQVAFLRRIKKIFPFEIRMYPSFGGPYGKHNSNDNENVTKQKVFKITVVRRYSRDA